MPKLSINKEPLSKALSFLSSGVPSKEIMGTDRVFQFNVEAESVTVVIANSKVQMSAFVACHSDTEVSFCVPVHIMYEMVRNFPDGNILISMTIDKDEVKGIHLSPEGQKKKYKIACAYNKDFPTNTIAPVEEEVLSTFSLPAGELTAALKVMASNTDPSDTRPCFSDICLIPVKEKLTFVAGNSKVFAFHSVNVPFDKGYIIRRQTYDYISAFTGNDACTMKITSQSLHISYGGFLIKTALCQGQLPAFQYYLDMEPQDKSVVINHKEFQSAISRMAPFCGELQHIEFTLAKDELSAHALNADFGNEAHEVVEVVNGSEIEFHIGANISYIKKMLQNISTDTIEMSHKETLLFIRPESNSDVLWMISLLATSSTKK